MVIFALLIVSFFTFAIEADAQKNYTGVVQTDTGPVVGEILYTVIKSDPYYSFRGIPYAEPPTNNLRFQPPVPKAPWNYVLEATEDKEKCIQSSDKVNVYGSEDCLYLSVYAPYQQYGWTLKPVVVWIHGGAFTTGYASKSYYGPDFLLEEDVVVVTLQYRLGPLGFLNVNHPIASGNNGLKDQNLALQWVQRNIAAFGGNPNQVTLLGQSAGGVSVDLHKLSPMSSGLFHQSISMSASPLCKYWAFQSHVEARTQAFLLGSKLGLKSDNDEELLNYLRTIPAKNIIEAASQLTGVPFRPTLERADIAPDLTKFLTECTPKLYIEGIYNKGPHMMGFTKNEILFLAKSLDDLIQLQKDAAGFITDNRFTNAISFLPQLISTPFSRLGKVEKAAIMKLLDELSKVYFVTGIDMKQKLLNRHNNASVYYYQFLFQSPQSAHRADGIKNLDGIAHEDELPYLFYRPHVELDLFDPRTATMRNRLVKLWANFIKYGTPTPNGESDPLLGVNWPNSGDQGIHLAIDDNLTLGNRPTDILVRTHQKLGFSDSKIYDCEPGVLSNVINSLVTIPGKGLEIVSDARRSVRNVVGGVPNGKSMVLDGARSVKSLFG